MDEFTSKLSQNSGSTKKVMKPSRRSFDEISAQAQKEFYEANGYHPTEEDCIRLTEEARAEIAKEREERKLKESN